MAVRFGLGGGVCCVCVTVGKDVSSSASKLMLACVGSSVGKTVDDSLKEESGVDALLNMLHRHVSMVYSLLLYSYN